MRVGTMLVLKRKEGQWVEITHKSGDKIRIRVYRIREGFPSQLDLAFDDDARNFEVQRPERKLGPMSARDEFAPVVTETVS
jgi:hypothetical protein